MCTPLQLACLQYNDILVKHILDKNPNLCNIKLSTDNLLHLVVNMDEHFLHDLGPYDSIPFRIKLIDLLLEKKPELINEKNADGDTPLYLASIQSLDMNNKDLIHALLRKSESKKVLSEENFTNSLSKSIKKIKNICHQKVHDELIKCYHAIFTLIE